MVAALTFLFAGLFVVSLLGLYLWHSRTVAELEREHERRMERERREYDEFLAVVVDDHDRRLKEAYRTHRERDTEREDS